MAFTLAFRLGCTVEELGQRISAQEFGEWKVWMSKEQLHPAADRARHAQLLAVISNGPVTRKVGGHFTAVDFMPAHPWAPAEATPPAASPQVVADQVAAINARFD